MPLAKLPVSWSHVAGKRQQQNTRQDPASLVAVWTAPSAGSHGW
jgi:hypothetical protein